MIAAIETFVRQRPWTTVTWVWTMIMCAAHYRRYRRRHR
jgi:hypothetical protein